MTYHHFNPIPLSIEMTSVSIIMAWWMGIAPALATTLTVMWVIYCFAKEFVSHRNSKPRSHSDRDVATATKSRKKK